MGMHGRLAVGALLLASACGGAATVAENASGAQSDAANNQAHAAVAATQAAQLTQGDFTIACPRKDRAAVYRIGATVIGTGLSCEGGAPSLADSHDFGEGGRLHFVFKVDGAASGAGSVVFVPRQGAPRVLNIEYLSGFEAARAPDRIVIAYSGVLDAGRASWACEHRIDWNRAAIASSRWVAGDPGSKDMCGGATAEPAPAPKASAAPSGQSADPYAERWFYKGDSAAYGPPEAGAYIVLSCGQHGIYVSLMDVEPDPARVRAIVTSGGKRFEAPTVIAEMSLDFVVPHGEPVLANWSANGFAISFRNGERNPFPGEPALARFINTCRNKHS